MLRPLLACSVVFLCLAASAGCTTTEEATDGGRNPRNDGGTGDSGTSERCDEPPCADGARCKEGTDCTSGLCRANVCLPMSATDGVKNAGETDIDCGGPSSGTPRCGDGKGCVVGPDCESLSCPGGFCHPPTGGDGIKNGTETDDDCGGGAPTNALRCATGKACAVTSDCDAVVCTGGVCQAPSSSDGIKNGTETDDDCGGGAPTNARRCNTGESCGVNGDCDAVACKTDLCQAATNDDEIENGSETDVDCGGGAPTNAQRCALDQRCTVPGDCGSDSCAVSGPKAGRCVPFKSCIYNNGGFTCGRDDTELGAIRPDLESCCETAALGATTTRINRFAITAGRMRAFITRLNGNVRGYVQNGTTRPTGWNAAWDNLVPATVTEAEMMLGQYWNNAPNDPNTTGESPHSKRSCGNDAFNGHTYFVQNEAGQVYTQAQLDPKVLNCVGWHLVTAFCAWDGGHVATVAELRNAFTNGGSSTWPWGYAGSLYNTAYNSGVQDDRLNHQFNYGFPTNSAEPDNRVTWWLSPPGRFWRGWNANKVEIAGNVLEWTSDQQYNMAWNMSFEEHTGTFNNGGDWRTPNDRSDVPNGYYALGARCAYP